MAQVGVDLDCMSCEDDGWEVKMMAELGIAPLIGTGALAALEAAGPGSTPHCTTISFASSLAIVIIKHV